MVGAGGLGCPALWALARPLAARGAALAIYDDDRIDVTNLQRQILYRDEEVGREKAVAAAEAVARRAPGLAVEARVERLDAAGAARAVLGAAAVLDGTDSFAAKFALNDECVAAGVPLVHGAVTAFVGHVMTVVPGAACFRCLFEAPPPEGEVPTCREAGVLGAVAGVVGARMAKEALAVLDGRPALTGTLLTWNALTDEERRLSARPRASCPACRGATFAWEARC